MVFNAIFYFSVTRLGAIAQSIQAGEERATTDFLVLSTRLDNRLRVALPPPTALDRYYTVYA